MSKETRRTYPTKRMSIKEYQMEVDKQFQGRFPPMDAECIYCGYTYGEHHGLECPKEHKGKWVYTHI